MIANFNWARYATQAPIRPSKPLWMQSYRIHPRNRTDSRLTPHCKRCGSVGEPDDKSCWKCGGEEMVA